MRSCNTHRKPLETTRRLKAQKISLTLWKFSQPVLAPLVCTFIIPFQSRKLHQKATLEMFLEKLRCLETWHASMRCKTVPHRVVHDGKCSFQGSFACIQCIVRRRERKSEILFPFDFHQRIYSCARFFCIVTTWRVEEVNCCSEQLSEHISKCFFLGRRKTSTLHFAHFS